MSERVPAQTIGELDIHLSHVQFRLHELAMSMANTATKSDIDGLRSAMSALATKAEVDSKIDEVRGEIATVRDDVQRIKPGTLFGNLVKVLSGLLVVGAFAALLVSVVRLLDRIPPAPMAAESRR